MNGRHASGKLTVAGLGLLFTTTCRRHDAKLKILLPKRLDARFAGIFVSVFV
jgi:hypothetical protein